MPRPDQSSYLAHFTKNGKEYISGAVHASPSPQQMSALEKLISILEGKCILATTMPWTNKKAICFTECPWGSLLRHADNYSPYGIGFTKKLIYSRNGNPVIYANPDMFDGQKWDPSVYPFVTPFVPVYAPDSKKNRPPFKGKFCDYTHEREWRLVKDFRFQYTYIQFVILNSYEDMDKIPAHVRGQIGENKFVFMETYKQIEKLWPTHIMD